MIFDGLKVKVFHFISPLAAERRVAASTTPKPRKLMREHETPVFGKAKRLATLFCKSTCCEVRFVNVFENGLGVKYFRTSPSR